MARHWNPKGELTRAREAQSTGAKPRWPEGATAGLVLVAAACVGIGVLLYHVAGPTDAFGP